MSSKSQHRLLSWVEREVRRCVPIALRYFRSSSLRVERKPDASPVTQADRLIEERLRQRLMRACPGERILGEEFGVSGRSADTYWTIDPIDGTRAFSCGLPSWGILIGRVEQGQATLGLCHFPVLGTTVAVAPGVRAYEQTHRRTVLLRPPRGTRTLHDAVIFHGGMRWWRSTPYLPGFWKLAESCFLERAYGDCYGYLWALRGQVDVVLDYGVKPWDLVPLAALAQATGRVLVNFSCHASFTGPDSIFASPSLARLVSDLLLGSSARRRTRHA